MAQEKKSRVNREIEAPEVRLIDVDGNQVGIVSRDEALESAEGKELDLVEIAPQAEPPVCRIMDYGKFVFDQNKKRQAAKRHQKQIHLKEVKFRPGTGEGDYQIKLRNLKRFLDKGDKVKVTLRFRGREMAHQELGREMLQRVENDLADMGTVEQYPRMEGRQMIMVITPKRS